MTTTTAEVADDDAPPRRSRTRRQHRTIARVIAVASGCAVAVAGARPTGTAVVDPLLSGAMAAVVTLAAGRARRAPVLALPLAAVALASGWGYVAAAGSVAAATAGASRRRRERPWGAATAALALPAMFTAGSVGFHGLPSIVVGLAVTPVLVSAYGRMRRRERRRVRRAVAVGAGVVTLIALAYGALALSVAGEVDQATTDSRLGLEDTRSGETSTARASFRRSAAGFGRADDLLNAWWATPARGVPVLAQHARALGGAASEGRRLAETAAATVEAADYQQLRYADGRFDVERIRSVQEPLERTRTAMATARSSLARNDSPWLLAPLADVLDDLDAEVGTAEDEADLAAHAVDVAPGLLGAEGPRRYFVAFVTPAELRGSGGFMGSWAEITATDGELRLTGSGPVRELFEVIPPGGAVTVSGPPDYLNRFGRFVGGPTFVGDMGYSPHFPSSAQVMAEVYPQVGGAPPDGVISIDPIALAALLEFTGPIEVTGFGRTLDADDAADFLLRENYRLFPDSDTQNEALAELVELAFEELTTGDLPGPRQISEVLAPATREGRLRLWSPVDREQGLFASIGADGAFPRARPDHDMIGLSSQNSGNNKIDVFQSRSVAYDVTLGPDGTLEASASIVIRNDAPTDGSEPDYVVGNTRGDPVGTNRMLFTVHTPHALRAATLDGDPIGVEPEVEAGFAAYTFRIAVPPGGEVTLEVDLVGRLDPDRDRYVLDLAPQPTVVPDEIVVTLDPGDGVLRRVPEDPMLGQDRIVIGS